MPSRSERLAVGQGAGSVADRTDHRELSAETPCCRRPISLNDLNHDSPQGFACLAVELMNPETDLEPEELRQVESALGTPVRIIWRHL